MRKQMLYDNVIAKNIGLPILEVFGSLFKNKIKEPVFLIALGRSGTTKLLNILSKHYDIAGFPTEGNMYWHPRSYPWIKSDKSRPPFWYDPYKFTELSLTDWTPRFEKRIKAVFGAYKFINHGKKVFLNKNVMLNFMVPKILELYPDAKFIHIYRDGRAVAYSYAKHEVSKIKRDLDTYKNKNYYESFEQVLFKMSELWSNSILEIEAQKSNLGSNFKLFELSYEEFCASPQIHLNNISKFLNINPAGFKKEHFADVRSMNYKFGQDLPSETVSKMISIMEPVLKLKKYI